MISSSETTYDENGNTLTSSSESQNGWSYGESTYDSVGNQLSETYTIGTVEGVSEYTSEQTYTYDSNGNVLTHTIEEDGIRVNGEYVDHDGVIDVITYYTRSYDELGNGLVSTYQIDGNSYNPVDGIMDYEITTTKTYENNQLLTMTSERYGSYWSKRGD